MKNRVWVWMLLLVAQFWSGVANASQEENKLMAVFLGRFASYIELPDRGSKHLSSP